MREELCDTNPPFPSLLAPFTQEDAIEGCFDDEAQTMTEVTPEPSVIVQKSLRLKADRRTSLL